MTAAEWERVCVLCAPRGRTTRLEAGHCCAACATWLSTTVASIAALAADAADWIAPGSSTGGGGRPVPGSRPPLRVDALDPELTPIGPPPSPTVLEVCEAWERMVRDLRGYAPYGAATEARTRGGLYEGTSATLVASVAFLGRSVPWLTTAADFPVEDFADEMRACVRVLRRWDHEAEDRGQMVPCPTVTGDEVCPTCRGEDLPCVECDGRRTVAVSCGHRLAYRTMDETVTCRRCGATRDVPQLLMAADADNAYADAAAISGRFGIDESTIRKWARADKVQRRGQRYRYGDVRVMVEAMRGRVAQ